MSSFFRATVFASASICALWLPAGAQEPPSSQPLQLVRPEGPAAPPIVVTLQDALARARENDTQFLASAADAESAMEDRLQARAALLPGLTHSTQELLTQGNGKLPSGRFVTNDGVHVYRSWAMLHQELSPNTVLATPLRRAQALETQAQARLEVARRGLAVVVTRSYYGLVIALRRYAGTQQAVEAARRFLDISGRQQRLGQVARSDEIKAELQFQQQMQLFRDAQLAMENARLGLAVLLFPTFSENFTVVDDLASVPPLPPFSDVRAGAERQNPDLLAATAGLDVAHQDVRLARHALLPAVAVDADYGIEANAFALRSVVAAAPQAGAVPNLGFFLTANLTVPVWDWGRLRSRVRQSQLRERQAQQGLSLARRQLLASLYTLYNDALAVYSSREALLRVEALAVESLRLTLLRYEAGESSALEVVDAQNTLAQARNAHDDAEMRYRVSLASLQSLSGSY